MWDDCGTIDAKIFHNGNCCFFEHFLGEMPSKGVFRAAFLPPIVIGRDPFINGVEPEPVRFGGIFRAIFDLKRTGWIRVVGWKRFLYDHTGGDRYAEKTFIYRARSTG